MFIDDKKPVKKINMPEIDFNSEAWLVSTPRTNVIATSLEDSRRLCPMLAMLDNCDVDDITVTRMKKIIISPHPDTQLFTGERKYYDFKTPLATKAL